MKGCICLFVAVVLLGIAAPLEAKISKADQAEIYRHKGYRAQQRGDLDEAKEYYQKAIYLDPSYAAPHNDLGILHEQLGRLDLAEKEYKKAISIDSHYLRAYTNLALLYEKKGELEKATTYWLEKAKRGNPNDPWTRRAKEKLVELGLLSDQELKELLKELSTPTPEETKNYLQKGKLFYDQGRYKQAIEELEKIPVASSESKEASEYINKAQHKIDEEVRRQSRELEKEIARRKKQRIRRLNRIYKEAIQLYRQGDYLQAREELKEMLRLIPGQRSSNPSY